MTTHRSLNKLEFKAHMSIHNKTEVHETVAPGSRYTRDRFGRNHEIPVASGRSRARKPKKILLLLCLVPLTGSFMPGGGPVWAEQVRRSTDMQIESGPIDELIDKKMDPPEERFAFYRDDEKSLELNENGDPNMNFRF